MQDILTMLQLRPYVFGFLVAFLFLAVRHWGWARTVLWLALGYGIAWGSEALSIRTGFPYGWYFYKYENLTRDILVAGVPFWDSLSYTFLIFAGYTVVNYRWPRLSPAATAMAGGAATMLLDIMIDPVSNLGDRWFLGSIYYYPTGGAHFGVPISNYIGWFFVSWLVISIFQRVTMQNWWVVRGGGPNAGWRTVSKTSRPGAIIGEPRALGNRATGPTNSVLYPLFYISIGAFNTAIAFWIGAWSIGIHNTVIMAGILYILCRRRKESLGSLTIPS